MFQKHSKLAIDIGRKYIKLMEAKDAPRGLSIMNYGMCLTPPNAFMEGNIRDKRDIIKSISDLMKNKRIKCNNVVFGIKGQDVIIRHIEMPIMPEKQLKQAVMLEMQQYLPMDPQEYVIDSKIIGRVDSKEKRANNILLVAAQKSKINDYFFIADKLNLKVTAIDLFANSTARLFEHKDFIKDNINSRKCISLIDIGYESSIITLIENGKLFFEREVPLGVKNIDIMLKKAFAISDEEIDAMRDKTISLDLLQKSKASDDPRVYYTNNSARQIVDDFIDNIAKVFDFYTSSGFGKIISNIYIFGGVTAIKGLSDYISGSLNIDTKVINKDLLQNVYNIDEDLQKHITLYMNCISLLLRKD